MMSECYRKSSLCVPAVFTDELQEKKIKNCHFGFSLILQCNFNYAPVKNLSNPGAPYNLLSDLGKVRKKMKVVIVVVGSSVS